MPLSLNIDFLTNPANATFWQAFGSIATAIGAIVTAFTFMLMFRQNNELKEQTKIAQEQSKLAAEQAELAIKTYKYTTDWQQKNKALELASFYERNIIPRITYVNLISKKSGFRDLLVKVKEDQMQYFTLEELTDLTSYNILTEVENKVKQLNFESFENVRNLIPSDMRLYCENKAMPVDNMKKFYYTEFLFITVELLNQLEYFSMNFNCYLADDSIVYQSLHQTFISTVKILYFKICARNTSGTDKFYTNIIKLYQKWNSKDKENKNIEKEALNQARQCIIVEAEKILK